MREVGVNALSQGLDTTTPGGRLFFHTLAAIAGFEHDLFVERTRDGWAAARARGRKGGAGPRQAGWLSMQGSVAAAPCAVSPSVSRLECLGKRRWASMHESGARFRMGLATAERGD